MTSVIQPGETIPAVPVKLVNASGTTDTTSDTVLGEGTVVFFTVPGAFTPTCNTTHLPGFVGEADKLRAAGATKIVCGSVNDQHVLRAWAVASEALGVVDFIADGNGTLAEALGLARDMSDKGMGVRYVRSAMIIDNGVVRALFREDQPGVSATGALAVLLALRS